MVKLRTFQFSHDLFWGFRRQIDLDEMEPRMAGPKRPQAKVSLSAVRSNFNTFSAATGHSILNSNAIDHGTIVRARITC